MTGPETEPETDTADRGSRVSWLGGVEAVLSIVSIVLVAYLPVHYIGTHLCFFGECSQPAPGEILVYWLVVAALLIALTATFAVAVRRRARWAFAWHGLVALTGVVATLVFSMPAIVDLSELDRDDPQDAPPSPIPGNVPCHSGPPNDCPGG